MSWIDEVLTMHADLEAPKKFFYWAALSALAAVARKNVYINRDGHFKTYANIYSMIVAGSGAKKGKPLAIAKQLVDKAEATRIISGRISVPKIISELGKVHTLNGTKTLKEAHAFISSGELSAFMVNDPFGFNILTDLYNTDEHEKEWKNSLKGHGVGGSVDILKSPCLTMFVASNEDLLETIMGIKEIQGGFIARTFIIGATSIDRGKPNLLLRKQLAVAPDLDRLAKYLKEVAKISGEFKFTPEALTEIETWYEKLYFSTGEDRTHTKERMGDRALKLSMLLSLSDDLNLVITKRHVEEAIIESESTWRFARKILLSSNKELTDSAKLMKVFKLLIYHPDHRMSRKEILRRTLGDINFFDLDKIIETLIGADVIKVYNHNTGAAVYELKDHAMKMFEDNITEIN